MIGYLKAGLGRRLFPVVGKVSRLSGKRYAVAIPGGDGSTGGPNTFRANFCRAAAGIGVTTTNSVYGKFDSLLVVQQYDSLVLKTLKSWGVRMVQRLDGMAYEEWAGPDWRAMNEPVQRVYAEIADAVIFQSNYAARQADYFLGARHPKSSVVPNGADRSLYFPEGTDRPGGPLRLLTTGNFRLPDLLKPQVELIELLRRRGHEVVLRVAGPVPDRELRSLLDREGIVYLGKLDGAAIASELRMADAFLFSMLNAACPNSVVEAISCGVPVIGYESGSLPELCWFNADLLAPIGQRLIHRAEDADPEILLVAFEKWLANPKIYREQALDHADSWNLKRMMDQYLEILLPDDG